MMPSLEAYEAHKSYWAAVAIVKGLLAKELITKKEYLTIETKIRAKWRPFFGTIPG